MPISSKTQGDRTPKTPVTARRARVGGLCGFRMAEYNARIRQKRDTSANWTAKDPILLDGEIIIVDTASGSVRKKVGDGTKK